jgi:hypothetical protein
MACVRDGPRIHLPTHNFQPRYSSDGGSDGHCHRGRLIGTDRTNRLSPLAEASAERPPRSTVLDGELCRGHPDLRAFHAEARQPQPDVSRMAFFAFDLTFESGVGPKSSPLSRRLNGTLLAFGIRPRAGPSPHTQLLATRIAYGPRPDWSQWSFSPCLRLPPASPIEPRCHILLT